MKKPRLFLSKIIYSLIVTGIASLLVYFASVFSFSFLAFVIIYCVYFYSIYKVEHSKYLYFYFIKTVKSLFFFLPISALIYSISLTGTIAKNAGDGLNGAAAGIGASIGGFFIVFICLIIGLIGGWIIGMFASKPKTEENIKEAKSIGLLFLLILLLCIYFGSQVSQIEKIIENPSNSGSQIDGVPKSPENIAKEKKQIETLSKIEIIDKKISEEYGISQLDIKVKNNTGRDIDAVIIESQLEDNFGELQTSFGSDKFVGNSQDLFKSGKQKEWHWSLVGFANAKKVRNIKIVKVHFTDGETINLQK